VVLPCSWQQGDPITLVSDNGQAADWIVLPVKVMERTARLSPLSATTPTGCFPVGGADQVIVDMEVVEQMGRRGGVGSVLLDAGDAVVVAGQALP
jgi:hypothetical protein